MIDLVGDGERMLGEMSVVLEMTESQLRPCKSARVLLSPFISVKSFHLHQRELGTLRRIDPYMWEELKETETYR